MVREFTRKSRTRLQQYLCSIPKNHVRSGALFVTLTYPDAYPGDWPTWKRQLGAWFDRLRRRCPRAGAVWKLEPQQRGAPHYHLYVVGTPFIAKEWLSQSWYEVVGSNDPRHLVAGTQVQQVRSHRGVLSYAAKYVAKAQQLPADWQGGVGRWWGVFNRAAFGVSWVWMTVTTPEYDAIHRVLRKLVEHRRTRRPRGPPRPNARGMWLPLTDTAAFRLVLWADTLARPPLSVTSRRSAALSSVGP